jgi:hypothetical protein
MGMGDSGLLEPKIGGHEGRTRENRLGSPRAGGDMS